MSTYQATGIAADPYLEITYETSSTTPATPPPLPPPPATMVVPAMVQDLSYAYDAVGNIIEISENTSTTSRRTVRYRYDGLDRLVEAERFASSASPVLLETRAYAYSPIGNILAFEGVGYGYGGAGYENPHAPTLIGASTRSYDRNGNLLSDGTFTYTWNYRNQLIRAVSVSIDASFAYDHDGNRVAVTLETPGAPSTARTTYSPTRAYRETAGVPTTHVFFGSAAVAVIEGATSTAKTFVLAADHLGSASVALDEQGWPVEFTDYDPFGSIRTNTRTSSFREERKYIGEVYDEATGLSYLNARYYGGSRGVFLSQDPVFWEIAGSSELLQDPQQLNAYSYARNNPINNLDPSGLFTVIVPGTNYNKDDWSESGAASDFISNVGKTFGETAQVGHWSGNDNPWARQSAAGNVLSMINEHQFAEGEKLNIIGHSHGGNIANLISQMTERRIDTLVTLGTPVNGDYQPNYGNIGQHINAYSRLDPVQRFGGTQTSASQLVGQALFGDVGGWVGGKLSFIQFGWAGRKFSGAENVSVTSGAGYNIRRAHSNLWRNIDVWSKISGSLK